MAILARTSSGDMRGLTFRPSSPRSSCPYTLTSAQAGPRTDSDASFVQVDGLMWITNSVFQGAGSMGRAIDTNTIDRGVPELFVSGAGTLHPCPAVLPESVLMKLHVNQR